MNPKVRVDAPGALSPEAVDLQRKTQHPKYNDVIFKVKFGNKHPSLKCLPVEFKAAA